MAFQTQDGARAYGSKFRASRYDRENFNPDEGNRAKAHEVMGTGERPNVDSRLHNNPHPEKFNTPLNAPGSSDTSPENPGEEQKEARAEHTVTCPHCGGEVSTGGASEAHSEPHEENAPSDTEKDVQDNKVAKGVWKPGQREHPDAEFDPDFEPNIL